MMGNWLILSGLGFVFSIGTAILVALNAKVSNWWTADISMFIVMSLVVGIVAFYLNRMDKADPVVNRVVPETPVAVEQPRKKKGKRSE